MNINSSCSICESNIRPISKKNLINKNTELSWESDSTFEILNLDKEEVFLGFCSKCLQTTIYPKFDTNLIYNEKSYLLRKKHYEKYYPGKIYGSESKEISLQSTYKKKLEELKDFKYINDALVKLINNKQNKTFTILDYGGGDGFMSQSFCLLIKTISNININVEIFDLIEEDVNKEKILNKKYDLIILSHIIEHLHEPKKVIHECKSLLSNNGLIYCEVPDERLMIIKSMYKRFGLHYHVTHHTRRSLHLLFNILGFKNIFTKYCNRASWRGNEISTIMCIVSNDNHFVNFKNKPTSFIYEFFSFLNRIKFYLTKKITH